jgi:small ligand-binding sensory domain FIST
MTRSEGNVILELGRKALVERLQDPYASLPDRDRELFDPRIARRARD